jgi:hypothetical protein
MGAFFVVVVVSAGLTSGVVVVAIAISLKGLTIIIAKPNRLHRSQSAGVFVLAIMTT